MSQGKAIRDTRQVRRVGRGTSACVKYARRSAGSSGSARVVRARGARGRWRPSSNSPRRKRPVRQCSSKMQSLQRSWCGRTAASCAPVPRHLKRSWRDLIVGSCAPASLHRSRLHRLTKSQQPQHWRHFPCLDQKLKEERVDDSFSNYHY